MGVLSHEIAHLQNFHILKRKKSIKKIKTIEKITTLSLIAGSLASNKSDYLLQSLITKEAGMHNYFFSFSQDQEREADYYAIETLDKLKLDKYPLIKLLNLLEEKSIQKGNTEEYQKFSTHPIFKERYDAIDNSKKFEKYNFDENINNRYFFIKAKLFGFTEDNPELLNKYLKNDYLIYADAIILARKGNLKKSLKLINNLIDRYPNNNFLLEVKADLLYSNGFLDQALLFYKKIINTNTLNNFINKRIFDIEFSLIDKSDKNQSKELFNRFSFLLKIFYNNKDLNIKFKSLANKSNSNQWIIYFDLNDKLHYGEIDSKKYKDNINKLKISTSDQYLKFLINKKIMNLNDK